MPDAQTAILTIDLAAIAANYRILAEQVAPATCAAAVKADAYGLGAAMVAPVLYREGCRHFFVATVDEGLALRQVLPHGSPQALIYILNGLPPVIYEDGHQERDFCFVEDIARANLLAAESDRLDGLAVNVGSGRGTSILSLAQRIAQALGVECEPLLRGEFRPGEIRRLVADTSLIRSAGWTPQVSLDDGIARYLDWVRTQDRLEDDFTTAEQLLRSRGIVQAAVQPPVVSWR